MTHLIKAILVAGFLWACVPSGDAVSSMASEELSRVQRFAIDPFEDPIGYSSVFGDAKPKIAERFGPPHAKETQTRRDRTSDAEFTISTLHYDGLIFVIGEGENGETSWIEKITITNNEHSLKFGIEIGSTRDSIIDALQTSDYIENESQLLFAPYVWEVRTDTAHRPGEEVRVEGEVEIRIELNENQTAKKIVFESIEL